MLDIWFKKQCIDTREEVYNIFPSCNPYNEIYILFLTFHRKTNYLAVIDLFIQLVKLNTKS